ncbi:MAG: hypothetical protein AAB690_01325 [Patescibacteria group bacterium]
MAQIIFCNAVLTFRLPFTGENNKVKDWEIRHFIKRLASLDLYFKDLETRDLLQDIVRFWGEELARRTLITEVAKS